VRKIIVLILGLMVIFNNSCFGGSRKSAEYRPTTKAVNALVDDTDRMNVTKIQAADNSGDKTEMAVPISGTTEKSRVDTLSYAGVSRVVSPSIVTLSDIEEYKKLISDYGIKVILYTDSAFYFEKNAVMYTINSNGIKICLTMRLVTRVVSITVILIILRRQIS
jgi:hypothetical protein